MSAKSGSIATTKPAKGRLRGQSCLIIGAGLGGLASALALAQKGAKVRVYERAPALREVGAGVQLGPNGVKVLDALGLAQGVRRVFDPATRVELCAQSAENPFARMDFASIAQPRWSAPMLQGHRADVLALLLQACEAAGVEVTPGKSVQVTEVLAEAVALRVGAQDQQAPLVIAADGLGSHARAQVAPGHSPRFTGHIAWRAILPARLAPPELMDRTLVACGAGAHTVTYPVRGGALLNIVAVEEGPADLVEDWSNEGDAGLLRSRFSAWPRPVREALGAVQEVRRWPLYDHDPLPTWSRGRLALLGDACHPMLPYMAQGATMAIEDAWVLADKLDTLAPEAAFAAYEQARKPRTTRVQRTARANGGVYHASGAKALVLRTGLGLISAAGPGLLHRRFDWLYGADVTAERCV